MDLKELLKLSPKLHEDGKGNLTSYQLSDEALSFIDKHVNEECLTLETGAGVSTILFAIKRSEHICITPNEREIERIISFCKQHKISTKRIKFYADRSERVLPSLKVKNLDFVLIDGRHAFPTPFIDWFYTAPKLKIGGLLMIDDTQLLTGKILKQFLLLEPEWELVKDFPPRTAVFKKLKAGSVNKWWGEQAFMAKSFNFS